MLVVLMLLFGMTGVKSRRKDNDNDKQNEDSKNHTLRVNSSTKLNQSSLRPRDQSVQPSLGLATGDLRGVIAVNQSDRTTATAINRGKGVQFLSFEITYLIAARLVRSHSKC